MLTSTLRLLRGALKESYAIGAFNIYNLEGVKAVISAAEAEHSPVMLQIHPSSLKHGGEALVALCLAAGRAAAVPVSVHLDHSTWLADIQSALESGLTSVMADGSHLAYADNVAFTREAAAQVHARGGALEAELGRLTGAEDGLTVPEYESRLTDPEQAADFVAAASVDALAVCIGNVHGRYRTRPELDFERLQAIRAAVNVPLVLHGASGLPAELIDRCIELGVCKFNVNTEVREAYVETLRELFNSDSGRPDLLELMAGATSAMERVVASKLRLFRSAGKARQSAGVSGYVS